MGPQGLSPFPDGACEAPGQGLSRHRVTPVGDHHMAAHLGNIAVGEAVKEADVGHGGVLVFRGLQKVSKFSADAVKGRRGGHEQGQARHLHRGGPGGLGQGFKKGHRFPSP